MFDKVLRSIKGLFSSKTEDKKWNKDNGNKKVPKAPVRKQTKKEKKNETSSEKKILDLIRRDVADLEEVRDNISKGKISMTKPDFDIFKKEALKKIKRYNKNISKLKAEDSIIKIEKSLNKYNIKLKKIEKLIK